MGNEVILLNFWASPFGMRVRIALNEKGVEYEHIDEDLSNKSELLLKMNPIHKKVPVLIHNNKPVCESVIAVQYIDEVWNDKNPLLPIDPYEKSQACFWADFIEKKIYGTLSKIWKTTGEDQEALKKEFIEYLTILEKQLGDKPFFGGEEFGFVDIVLIPFYIWFYAFETGGFFKIGEPNPKLKEWATRCMLRESVSEAVPDKEKLAEFLHMLKKKFSGN